MLLAQIKDRKMLEPQKREIPFDEHFELEYPNKETSTDVFTLCSISTPANHCVFSLGFSI